MTPTKGDYKTFGQEITNASKKCVCDKERVRGERERRKRVERERERE